MQGYLSASMRRSYYRQTFSPESRNLAPLEALMAQRIAVVYANQTPFALNLKLNAIVCIGNEKSISIHNIDRNVRDAWVLGHSFIRLAPQDQLTRRTGGVNLLLADLGPIPDSHRSQATRRVWHLPCKVVPRCAYRVLYTKGTIIQK